jgi:DNA adenine methylase
MQLTVLRYPGGKARAVKHLKVHIPSDTVVVVSPYFGGGALELYLASHGVRIVANDLFEPLYNFWVMLQRHPDELVAAISLLREGFDKIAFHACRARIADAAGGAVDRAACYFAVNRTSFNGSTMSGGFSSSAVPERFTRSCVERLSGMRAVLSNVEFHNLDGVTFLRQHAHRGFAYIDPPYMLAAPCSNKLYGTNGDMHAAFDHAGLHAFLRKYDSRAWLLSYNDGLLIRELYDRCRIECVTWSYGMNTSKRSSEVIIRRHAGRIGLVAKL